MEKTAQDVQQSPGRKRPSSSPERAKGGDPHRSQVKTIQEPMVVNTPKTKVEKNEKRATSVTFRQP